MSETWTPEEGQWVVYQAPHDGALSEDGTITEVVSPTLVRVRYWADGAQAVTKTTRTADLTLGPGEVPTTAPAGR